MSINWGQYEEAYKAIYEKLEAIRALLPTSPATEATLLAIKTAVELIDNMISGSEAQVDVVSSALPAGAATENTLVSGFTAMNALLTSIKTAVELIDNMISGSEAQVDVITSALPTGASTEATLAAVKTAVELIDNMISGSEAQVDVVTTPEEGTITFFSVSTTTDIKTVSGGAKLKALGWNFYCTADIICELRYKTSGNVIAGIPTKGVNAMAKSSLNRPEGAANETIEMYLSGTGTVKGWVSTKEV